MTLVVSISSLITVALHGIASNWVRIIWLATKFVIQWKLYGNDNKTFGSCLVSLTGEALSTELSSLFWLMGASIHGDDYMISIGDSENNFSFVRLSD